MHAVGQIYQLQTEAWEMRCFYFKKNIIKGQKADLSLVGGLVLISIKVFVNTFANCEMHGVELW